MYFLEQVQIDDQEGGIRYDENTGLYSVWARRVGDRSFCITPDGFTTWAEAMDQLTECLIK